MKIRHLVNDVLSDGKCHTFEDILAGVVINELCSAFLTEQSVRLCFDLKDEVSKVLQEMISCGQVGYDIEYTRIKSNA